MPGNTAAELQIIISAQIAQAQEQLSAVGREAGKMAADLQSSGSISSEALDGVKRSIDELKLDMQTMRDAVVGIRVDDSAAVAKAEEFKAELDTIPHEKVVDVRTVGGAGGGSGASAGAGGAGADAAGGAGILGPAIMTALPAIAPLAAVTASATMGLAGAFAAASAGVAGFAVVAIPNIKSITTATAAANAAQIKYNEATTKAQKASALAALKNAYYGLDAAQVQAVHSLQQFESFFKSFSGSFQTPVLADFNKALQIAKSLLTDMRPVIQAGATAIGQLMDSMNKGLNSSGMKTFFTWLANQAGPAITMFGAVFGNVFSGMASLFEAFTPSVQSVESGLVSMTSKFASWAASLSSTQGFKDFLNYVKTEGPQVMKLIGQLAQLVGRLLVAMAPAGAVVLKIVTAIVSFTNSMLKAHPQLGKLAVDVIAAVAAFKLLSPGVMGAINGIKAFGAGISSTLKFAKELPTRIGLIGLKMKDIGTGAVNAAKSVGSFTASLVKTSAQAVATSAKVTGQFVASMVKSASQATATAAVFTGKLIASMVKTAVATSVATAKIVAQGAVFVAQKAAVLAYTVAQTAMTVATTIATAATTAFGVALDIATGPIGIIIAALVALGVVIYELIKHWSTVKADTEKVWNDIAAFFTKIWGSITSGISKAWNAIVNFFKKYGADILAALTGPIGILVLELVKHWSTITSDATKAWNALVSGIKSIISTVVDTVEKPFNAIGQFFTNLASEALQWGSNLIGNFVRGITNAIGAVKNAIGRVVSAIAGPLAHHSPAEEGVLSTDDQWMPNMMNMFVQGIQQGIPKVQAALNQVMAPAQNMLGELSVNASATHSLTQSWPASAVPASAGGGGIVIHQLNVTGNVTRNEEELANKVASTIQKKLSMRTQLS